MFGSKMCKSNQNCAWNLAIISCNLSHLLYGICQCEHLHYESVYFKELHNEQEYY